MTTNHITMNSTFSFEKPHVYVFLTEIIINILLCPLCIYVNIQFLRFLLQTKLLHANIVILLSNVSVVAVWNAVYIFTKKVYVLSCNVLLDCGVSFGAMFYFSQFIINRFWIFFFLWRNSLTVSQLSYYCPVWLSSQEIAVRPNFGVTKCRNDNMSGRRTSGLRNMGDNVSSDES